MRSQRSYKAILSLCSRPSCKVSQRSKLWSFEDERHVVQEIKAVSQNCNFCKLYKKAPAVPVVSIPMTKAFNELVAMDLVMLKEGTYIAFD